jgi:hypothetical protein
MINDRPAPRRLRGGERTTPPGKLIGYFISLLLQRPPRVIERRKEPVLNPIILMEPLKIKGVCGV